MTPRFRAELRRLRLTVTLLLGRRTLLFAVIDGFVVFTLLVAALVGGDRGHTFWVPIGLVPLLLIGVPALSDAVALERRAGGLELALSSAGGRGFFWRRALGFLAALVGQAILLFALVFATIERVPIAQVLLRLIVIALVLATIVVFWAVRLQTAGGVTLATILSFFALGKWTLANPIPDPLAHPYGLFFVGTEDLAAFLVPDAVLLGTALVFFLYADRRLARPERILR